MKELFRIRAYLSYLLRSFHLHGVHSPFVFNFINDIIKDKSKYYAFDQIEGIRAKLILSHQEINFTDFGAKFDKPTLQKRTISSIAKKAAQEKKYGELIFKLIKSIRAEKILELGTSFGIGTAYLSMPTKKSKIISLEGSPEIAKVALLNHQKLEIENVEVRNGEFSTTLNDALKSLKKVDVVYFDGNHEKEATLNYFHRCLDYADENTVFIFDDIYWSKGMAEAWKEICGQSSVTVTIDLFKIGLVFFKKDQAKENFTVYH